MLKALILISLFSFAFWNATKDLDPTSVLLQEIPNDSLKTDLKVDYSSFLQLSNKVEAFRAERKIDIATFYQYALDHHTIILDTRSKQAFEESHLEGAIHLNFSDFTEQKLASLIPNKQTRILIYCNNNFNTSELSLQSKLPPLALNIPTFINLYGYGYKNIYELESVLSIEHPKLFIKNRPFKGFSPEPKH